MLKKLQKTIDEFHMILPDDVVMVGISGGADSVALLLGLCALRQKMQFILEAIHVEHGIRGMESCQDAAFVKDLCQRMQVPLHMVSVDVPDYCKEAGLGTEEAARELRYRAFVKLAKEKKAKVALAHHMEDNAETVLFQLLRGSALTGLCGMQPIRQDEEGVTYIRPLLYSHRTEIEDFLKARGQSYRVDSTNMQLDYTRNYIRNVIYPELEKVNARAVEHINATATQLSDVRDFLMQETKKAWMQVLIAEECGLVLDIEKLNTLHLALRKEIIYKAISDMAGARKDVSQIHVADVLRLCDNQSGRQIHLADGVVVQKEYQKLKFFYKENPLGKSEDNLTEKGNDICVASEMLTRDSLEIVLNESGEKLLISTFPYEGENVEIPQKAYTKWMDYDKIKNGFCIRTRRTGDVFIADAQGHRKKLKQYLIDEKIPLSKRDTMWLLAQDEIVLWLIGGRMSEHVKVTADTKRIIEITYDGGC